MGNEATVRAVVNGKADRGKALLETNEVIFRGAQRCVVKLPAKASAKDGWLKLGTLELELGPAAEKWAEKINHPRSVLDKLGVKPGQVAALIGAHDASFTRQLHARGVEVGKDAAAAHAIFVRVSEPDDLKALGAVRRKMRDDAALWVVRPKGKGAAVGEHEARAAGLETGLVDVKVVGFSETLSAEKYVVPLAKRKK